MKSDSLLMVLAMVAVVAVVSLVLYQGGVISGGAVSMHKFNTQQMAQGCSYTCKDATTLRVSCALTMRDLDCPNGCDPGAKKCK